MSKLSVLGFLSTKLSSSTENIATEALCYILQNSTSTREGLVHYLGAILTLGSGFHYRTQVLGEDRDVPDLIGIDEDSKETLIIESKFWAGLTSNQPVTYLSRLPSDRDSLLLFIAPFRRFPTLWPELLRRCNAARIPPNELATGKEALLAASLPSHQFIALTSWKALLEFLSMETASAGDATATNDLAQLQGLAVRMDEEAFLPLKSEEMAPGIAVRFLQYLKLIDDSVELLKQEGNVSTKGGRSTRARARYSKYFSLPGFGCALEFHPRYWSTVRETPLWIAVWGNGSKWRYSEDARKLLDSLHEEHPSRLFRDGEKLIVPVYLPVDQERDAVLASIVTQAREVIHLLEKRGA